MFATGIMAAVAVVVAVLTLILKRQKNGIVENNMTLCNLGIHLLSRHVLVWCDDKSYPLGKQCACGKRRVVDWHAAAWAVSQAYTDGKMAQLLNQQKGEG